MHLCIIPQTGNSALMMASKDGRTEIVSMLLQAGSNIDLQNKV